MGSHTYNRSTAPPSTPTTRPRARADRAAAPAPRSPPGMLPLADGSDLGGSLRNPANFNNVVGFGPPSASCRWRRPRCRSSASAVKGPMARSVADTAFLLSVMAGPDARDPGCYPIAIPPSFARPLDREPQGRARRVVPRSRRASARPRACAPSSKRSGARSRSSAASSRKPPGSERRRRGVPHLRAWRRLEHPRTPPREAPRRDEARGDRRNRARRSGSPAPTSPGR